MKNLTYCIILFCLCACNLSLKGSGDSKEMYVLDVELSNVEIGESSEQHLYLAPTRASNFIDSKRIIFSKDKLTRGFYQYSSWVESPVASINRIILNYIDTAKIYASVSNEKASGNLQLMTELLDFYHDATSRPGEVRVSLLAEVYEKGTARLVGRKKFEVVKPATSYNARGAVEGFNQSVNEIGESLVQWMRELSK